MNDSQFTPALFVWGIVLGGLLAYLEMLWLKRPLQFVTDWRAWLLIAIVNALFVYLLLASLNTHLFLLIIPVPLIPIAYIIIKCLLYMYVRRLVHAPLHGPIKLAILSLFFHAPVALIGLLAFAAINPTRSNLETAIREQKNGLLDLMLWISVKTEPNMSILVNEAITVGNDDAVRRLIRRGASPNNVYWISRARPEIMWRITKWRLERGVDPEHIGDLNEQRDIGYVAVSYGLAELQYCLKKGLEPKRHPRILQDALENQPLPSTGVITPEEQQIMKDKIALLIDRGADVNGPGDMRFKPVFNLIFLDAKLDLSPVLALLLERGADVNALSPNPVYPDNMGILPKGMTPLMMAVALNRPRYIDILLKHGADKTIRDSEGHLASDYVPKGDSGLEIKRRLGTP
jgi:ankyrin repeat protein